MRIRKILECGCRSTPILRSHRYANSRCHSAPFKPASQELVARQPQGTRLGINALNSYFTETTNDDICHIAHLPSR